MDLSLVVSLRGPGGRLDLEVWTDSSFVPLVVNLLELGFMLEKEPLSSVLLRYLSVSLKPSSGLRKDAFSELLPPPLDALLGPVEEPNCPPVHGFPRRHGCHGFIVPCFKVKSFNLKIAF